MINHEMRSPIAFFEHELIELTMQSSTNEFLIGFVTLMVFFDCHEEQQPTKSAAEMERKRSEAKRNDERRERQDPESDPDADPNPKDNKGTRSPRYSTKSG